MRILLWHVHGSWTNAFVRGHHEYLLPVNDARDGDGLGRARTWDWPATVREVTPEDLRDLDVDLVVLQRPHEEKLASAWLRREPGRDVPMVYVEHNTPRGDAPCTTHPMADRRDVTVVHITHFNNLMWDCGGTRSVVVEHGIVDPGARYTGELARVAVAVNEPMRRWRVTGTDLLPAFADAAPVDVFGMKVTGLDRMLPVRPNRVRTHEDLPQAAMHREIARRRVYAHPMRWTSLGLSLLEAMALGMPVVALATTAASEAVPAGAGVLSTRVDVLRDAVRSFLHDSRLARETGARAREAALARFGLVRFLSDWDRLLEEVTA